MFTDIPSASDLSSSLAAACAARFAPAGTPPLVSVIVPVFNNWDVTERCLASVVVCDSEIPIELIVVDDASTDETPRALAALPGIVVVRNDGNAGFVHSCNRGAARARGTYLFFLNNDTELHVDSIAALVQRIERDSAIGIVGSKLVYPDGKLQEAGGIIWSDGFAWNYGRLDDADRPEYNFVRDVDYVSGAALLVRAELFRGLHGFDERYAPAYYEDADLCFAARACGMRVVYEPASVVTHFEGLSAGHDMTAGMKRFYEINRPKFESKWYAVLRNEHHEFAESNVRQAARRRGPAKPAVLVVGEPLSGDPGASHRLARFASALGRAGRRVSYLPHDLDGAGPWRQSLQGDGVEVLFRGFGDQRDWREVLTEALPAVDVVVIGGAPVCRRYLPAIRAQCETPIVFDAAGSALTPWMGESLGAICVRAADATIVASEADAESVLEAGYGPLAVVPLGAEARPAPAVRLIEYVAAAAGAPATIVEAP